MAIREEIVASAAQFLQDPSVASSPVENRIAFLRAKNLTEEEVHAALARAGGGPAATPAYATPPAAPVPGQPPAYYGGYPPYGWPPQQPEVPRRDWRDWFIMATMVGGVGYGLYTLGKRYVYPLVAPPTPERLETEKKSIDEQFEKAFTLVEQLSKDTGEIKAAEQQRNEKLNGALAELETVIGELKSSNRRREDEAQRIRDDVQGLKDSIPRALDAQKNLSDTRLQEVNSELKSLKTIISQRMSSQPPALNNYLNRPTAVSPTSASAPTPAAAPAPGNQNGTDGTTNGHAVPNDMSNGGSGSQDNNVAGAGRSSPFSSGISAASVKIPEWQRAMATKRSSVSITSNSIADGGSGSQSQAEAGGSSS